jgi:hypothetical protein
MRFLLLSACISTSQSLLADIFHPSLIPVKNCIQARLIYGEEIIRYSKEPPFIVYFNGAGKDIETTLIRENEFSGYITSKFPTGELIEITSEFRFFISSTIFIRKPSIFEKYLAGNRDKCFYEVKSKYGRFLMNVKFISDEIFVSERQVNQALSACLSD